jgi:hypothetical protein
LAILIVVSAAHVFLFTSSILDRHNLSSISDPRFLSVLAVIPCLHLACALLAKSSATRIDIALALLQSTILVFAIWIRTTAIWTILALSMLATGVLVTGLLNRRFELRRLWSLGLLLAACTRGLDFDCHSSGVWEKA